MAVSQLVLHRGARAVTFDELAGVPVPSPRGRWFPIAHASVLQQVKSTLAEFQYTVEREQLALSRGDARFFGTLDLGSRLTEGVTLSVGVRSSIDQSFPLGFVAGSRVFVCDNLAFRSELLVRRKHTRHGQERFSSDIADAVVRLGQFREQEAERVRLMEATGVSEVVAESLILRAFERGIIPARLLSRTISAWREPAHEQFRPRNYWSLFNAVTTALGERTRSDPQGHAVITMRLGALLTQAPGLN